MKGSNGTGAKRTNQLFFDAFKASPIGIALEDLEGRPLFVNPALCSMLGFSEEELLRKHCSDFSPPEDAEKDWLLFRQLKAGAIDNYHLDKRYFRRDGSLIWGRLSISLMKNGGPQMVVAMVEDITEKKAAQENLELAIKQNAMALQFQSLLSDLSRTFIGLPEEQVDANIERGLGQIGEFLEMDRIVLFEFSKDRTAMPTAFSWSASGVPKARPVVRTEVVPWCMNYLLRGEAMLVSNLNDLPDDALLEREFFQQAGIISAAAIPLRLSNQINGGIVFITVRRQVSWSEDLVAQLKIIGDIFWNALKRKRAHEAMLATQALMRESEERFRLAAQAGTMWAYEWDAATDKIVRSEEVNDILGQGEPRHTTGQHILSRIPPEDRGQVIDAVARLSPAKPFLRIRHRMTRSDGTVIWVARRSQAQFDEYGKMLRMRGMLADVTDRVRAEEALQESQRQLLLVYSNVADCIFDVAVESDDRYRFLSVNPAFLKATGLAEDQVVGKLVKEVIPEPSLTMVLGKYEEAIGDKKTVRWEETSEYPAGRKMGEITVTPVFDETGRCTHLIGAVHDVTERKLAEEALADMSRKLVKTQEQERARIARELHDDVAQRLALLSVGIEQMKQSFPASELRSQLDELEKQTSDVSADIQSLSHELHSSRLEHVGIVSAMKGFCREFGNKNKVEVAFDSEGAPPTVPQEVSLCLFRVMQEGLRNAVKHSGVRLFEVKLNGSRTELHLSVRDSGMGFDPELARNTPGLGLISMQERIRLVEGTISITSRPQSGTEISVRVPLAAGKPTEQTKWAEA